MIPLKCESCDYLHYYKSRVRDRETLALKCPECHGGGVTRLYEEVQS
jgi:Zn finger protein HypA/HybF involved in hydrogenase expression